MQYYPERFVASFKIIMICSVLNPEWCLVLLIMSSTNWLIDYTCIVVCVHYPHYILLNGIECLAVAAIQTNSPTYHCCCKTALMIFFRNSYTDFVWYMDKAKLSFWHVKGLWFHSGSAQGPRKTFCNLLLIMFCWNI